MRTTSDHQRIFLVKISGYATRALAARQKQKLCACSQQVTTTIDLSLGYSSLKSRDMRAVHSRRARILAAISLPAHVGILRSLEFGLEKGKNKSKQTIKMLKRATNPRQL